MVKSVKTAKMGSINISRSKTIKIQIKICKVVCKEISSYSKID